MTGADIVTVPGFGRVLFAFLLVAGLAVAAAFGLRRFLPRFAPGPLARSGAMRVVDRITVGAGVRVHVIEVDGAKVMLAESRGSLALLALSQVRDGISPP